MLTTPQLATLKKFTVRRELLNDLSLAFESGNDDPKPSGILERIKVSKDQMKELRRLSEERDRMVSRSCREMGETALKILSPQQQDKFLDALEESQGF